MRIPVLVILLSLLSNVALATPQIADTIRFGGRDYWLLEVPMLGLWDFEERMGFRTGTGREKPPPFDVRSSANWDGYEAVFEIRDSKLYLSKIVGYVGGTKRRNAEVLPKKTFPLEATWFTGRIHIAVGDDDPDTGERTAVIQFDIEQGQVKSMTFRERMKPPGTWNGLPSPNADAPPENPEPPR